MWEKANRPSEHSRLYGSDRIWHRYTAGVAGQRFLHELKENRRLVASRCPKCQRAFLPPAMYCQECFVETAEWVPVTGPGKVATFSVLHLSLDEEPLDKPVVVAFIQWEGFSGGLIHRLGEVALEAVGVGMAVEPVWQGQRAGSVLDIAYFRPLER